MEKLRKIWVPSTCRSRLYVINVRYRKNFWSHYSDVTMRAMASQITSPTIVYSTVYSGADQRKYQSSAPLVFERGIHRWLMNFLHKRPVTRKMFPFDDVIMNDNATVEIQTPGHFVWPCDTTKYDCVYKMLLARLKGWLTFKKQQNDPIVGYASLEHDIYT